MRNSLVLSLLLCLLCFFPAQAQEYDDSYVVDNYRYSGCADTSGTPIAVTGVLFDLSASTCASYQTGQTLKNIITSPADGTAKAGYDFYFGDTSGVNGRDPVFSGTAGSTAAYFGLDGSQYFSLVSGAGGPSALADLHREDMTVTTTFLMAMHYEADGTRVQNLFGNNSSSSATHGGFRLGVSTAGVLQLLRNTGDASNTNNTISTGITLTDNTDYVVAFTFNSSTMAWKASINGATFSASGTGTALTSALNSHTCTDTFTIGSVNKSTSVALTNTSKIYAASMYNVIMSDSDYATIRAIYEARFAKDFTP